MNNLNWLKEEKFLLKGKIDRIRVGWRKESTDEKREYYGADWYGHVKKSFLFSCHV